MVLGWIHRVYHTRLPGAFLVGRVSPHTALRTPTLRAWDSVGLASFRLSVAQQMADRPTNRITPNSVVCADCFNAVDRIPDNSIQTVVTSPPYWGQRDYQIDAQIGVEERAQSYVDNLVSLFADLQPKLTTTASVWLNIGDTYNGCSIIREADTTAHPRKGDDEYEQQLSENRDASGVTRRSSSQWGLRRQSRMFIPSRIARRLCEDHNYRLRDNVVWAKPSAKPEGRVSTRLRQSHERIYRFVTSESATFSRLPECETDVWEIPTGSDSDHPAPFPVALPDRAIRMTTEPGDVVLDPFCGSGNTLIAAERNEREWIGIDCHEGYVSWARERVNNCR